MKSIVKILGAVLLAIGTVASAHAAAATGVGRAAAAYDPVSSRYLVVYEYNDPGVGTQVRSQLVNADGVPMSSAVSMAPAGSNPFTPDVAYDAGNKRFMVTWTDLRNGNPDVFGQLVNADGTLDAAGNFAVYAGTASQTWPVITYDAGNGRFLVAWTDNRNVNYDVYGQLVNANGTLNGVDFAVIAAAGEQYNQSVAYDAGNGRFLVVWEDTRNGGIGNEDIYGQLVNASGTLNGADFAISTDAANQVFPNVAWDAGGGGYLVAWNDLRNGNYDIYGQLVNAGGTLNGTNFAVSADSTAQSQLYPDIAYDSGNGRYLVAWHDIRNGNFDIYGQVVNANGSLDAAGNFVIAATANQDTFPDLAYNPVCGNMLAAYNSTDPTPLSTLGLTLVGSPCPVAVSSGGCGQMIPTNSNALWMIPILLLLLLGIGLARRRA